MPYDPNQAAWEQAFRDTHGGLSIDEYNYLHALQQAAQQGQAPGVVAPPAPAAPAPPGIQPFLTPDQQMTFAQANFQTSTNLADIDRALADIRTQTGYQRTQNDREATQVTSQAKDSYAARGLSRSSVRDGGLYDIQAQNTIRQNMLNDQLNNAELSAQVQKQNIASYGDQLARSRAGMMAQNASSASSQLTPAPQSGSSPSATSDIPGVSDAQYQQQYGAGSQWASSWEQAFRDSHGGLSVDEYNYLQSLYHTQNG